MLRSAVGLALWQSASASRLFQRSQTERNYDTSKKLEFRNEDFAGCTGVEFMIGAFACGIALVFRHYTTPPYEKESRYSTASYETKSTPESPDTCQHGQHGREKTE